MPALSSFSNQTVNRLTIKAEAQGVREAEADLKRLSGAQAGVASASEKVTRSTLSADTALDKLRRTVDAQYRAEQQLAKGRSVLERAAQQGLLSMRERDRLETLAMGKYARPTIGMAGNDNDVSGYSRVTASLTRIAPVLSSMGMGEAVGAMGGGAFAGIAAGITSVVAAAAGIASAGDQWTAYANRLTAAGEASQTVGARQRELVDIAIRSRAELGGVVDLYSNMGRALAELNVPQSQVARVTETITKSFTLSGGSAAGAAGAIQQLSQAFAAGTLRGDEFNSVMEQAPGIARLIAQEFGVGMGDLRKMAEDGKLSAERVFQAIANGADEVDREFGRTALTMSQGSANAGTALTELGAAMDQTFGLSQKLAAGFQGVANAARGMAAAVADYGDGRKVMDMQGKAQAVLQYEMNVKALEGRNDFASRQDLTREQAALENARRELRALQETRVQSMVPPVPEIRLNAEGGLTSERTVKALARALDDLTAAEKKQVTEGLGPLEKATAEATAAHEARMKVYDSLRAGGAEQAKINAMIAQSENVKRIAIEQATAAAAKKAGRGSASAEDGFERPIISAQGRTRQMEEETRLLGVYGGELEATRLRIDLETQAKRRGLDVSGEVLASIDQEVEARRAAAKQLESMRELERIQQEFSSIGRDALGGFINDLRQGTSAADALQNALGRVADRLLDMALKSMFDSNGGGGGLLSLIAKGIGSLFGAPTGLPTMAQGGMGPDQPPGLVTPHANGGVFGPHGSVPLNTYANGGIAHSPQLALFGEGRTPEAYVPLPDGRTIPVTMQGAAAPPVAANVNLTVVNNGAPVKATTREKRDGNGGFNIEVVLDAAEVRMANNVASGRGPLRSATGSQPRMRG